MRVPHVAYWFETAPRLLVKGTRVSFDYLKSTDVLELLRACHLVSVFPAQKTRNITPNAPIRSPATSQNLLPLNHPENMMQRGESSCRRLVA